MSNTCTPPQTQGNNKLRVGLKAKNRLLLREAVDFYNKGLAVKCSDNAINVALYNNKAHVNSLLGEVFALCQHRSRKPSPAGHTRPGRCGNGWHHTLIP